MSSLCRTTTLSAWISCSSSRRSVLGTLFQLQDGSCHKAFGICADVIQQDFQQIVIWCDTVPTNSDYVHAASIYNLPTHQLKINNKWSIEQKWHFLEYPFVSTPRYPLHTIFTTEIGALHKWSPTPMGVELASLQRILWLGIQTCDVKNVNLQQTASRWDILGTHAGHHWSSASSLEKSFHFHAINGCVLHDMASLRHPRRSHTLRQARLYKQYASIQDTVVTSSSYLNKY